MCTSRLNETEANNKYIKKSTITGTDCQHHPLPNLFHFLHSTTSALAPWVPKGTAATHSQKPRTETQPRARTANSKLTTHAEASPCRDRTVRARRIIIRPLSLSLSLSPSLSLCAFRSTEWPVEPVRPWWGVEEDETKLRIFLSLSLSLSVCKKV